MLLELAIAVVGTVCTIAVTKAICDELSEEEKRKQQAMRDEYYLYKKRRQEEYNSTVSFYNHARESNYKDYEEELQRYQKNLVAKLKRENRKIYESYINNYNDWRNQKVQLANELETLLKSFEENNDRQQNSYIRYSSLRQTVLLTTEGFYKVKAYIKYLDNWKDGFEKLYEESGEITEPFDFKLPESYPYNGKVMNFHKEDFEYKEAFKDYAAGYYLDLEGNRIWLNNLENEVLEETDNDELLPFMVYEHNNKFYFSLTRGLIKNSIGGTQGFKAQVLEVQSSQIRLGIRGQEYPLILLPKSELKKKNSRNPVGATMQVFVKEYEFDLSKKTTVSEKPEAGFNIESFDTIPLIESKEEYSELKKLYEYLKENKLLEEADEWRIAPLYEDSSLIGFKMQQGNNYAFRVFLDNSFGEKRLAFRYGGLIENKEDYISFDDMFVTTNVSVKALNPSKIRNDIDKYEPVFEECNKLSLYLSTEFTNQKRIMQKTPMSNYLNQWEEVTRRLIDSKRFQYWIEIQVEKYEQRGENTVLSISNEEELSRFIKKQNDNTRYFITKLPDVKRVIPCEVNRGSNEIKIKDIISEESLIENNFKFNLYAEVSTYVEKQQLNALSSFRTGVIANDDVKAAIVNVSETEFVDNGNRIQSFFNKSIYNNKAQQDAIIRAFASQSFFIIQGPPGTGKTTVIKELIFQQLVKLSYSRILVVSQANVAVDNVIRGILSQKIIADSQIIRCGTEDKLADDIIPYSFDTKIEEYKSKINNISFVDETEKLLLENWKELLAQEDDSLIGEYLLKQYQIVGATCVGLENRKYGLSDMEFDLVIIDEAGKALPGELLIPINHAKKLIVIGDHKQLPPVIDTSLYQGGNVEYDDVVTQEERDAFLEKSFFYRLYEKCPDNLKCMLNIQFRMPPVIANLVNLFYDNQLSTGENCKLKTPLFLGNNLIFIDMKDEPDYKEYKDRQSVVNDKEIEVLKQVVLRISEFYKNRIVVITPYKGQKFRLSKAMKDCGFSNVYVNTIDALQGDEEDVVIYCTTRAITPTKYFSDAARLNVAFSRARNTLFFIGSSGYCNKYKKGHIMRDIGEYLLKNAKMTTFDDWKSISYELNYCALKETSNTSVLNNEKTFNPIEIPSDFFEKLSAEKSIEEKRLCVHCSKELEDWEETLCSSCINKVQTIICKGCRKAIDFSFYDKYIRNMPEPKHCENCIEVECERCNKFFLIEKEKYNKLTSESKEILCYDCLQKKMEEEKELVSIGCCEACGCNIEYPRYILKKNPNLYGNRLHKDCKDNTYKRVSCSKCGDIFSITYGEKISFEKKGFDLPKKCKSCRG